jgi:hypothetical protein
LAESYIIVYFNNKKQEELESFKIIEIENKLQNSAKENKSTMPEKQRKLVEVTCIEEFVKKKEKRKLNLLSKSQNSVSEKNRAPNV